MRTLPERTAALPLSHYRIFSPASPEFSTHGILQPGINFASGTWFSANDPLAIPFRMSYGFSVKSFWWRNGSAAGGNFDVGIYDTSWNRLLTTGSTAGTGNSSWQNADVTDTYFAPGGYYFVMVLDNVTANRITLAGVSSNPLLALAGVQDSATDAFALPDPLTDMAAAATAVKVPCAGFKAVSFPW